MINAGRTHNRLYVLSNGLKENGTRREITTEGMLPMADEKRGQAALFDALTTKGTAFSEAERRSYGLLGLLPTAVKTLEEQAEH